MKQHREAGPTAVSRALATKGIKVSPAHVSNVVAADKRKKTAKKGAAVHSNGKPGRRPRAASNGQAISLAELMEARDFAAHVGGVAKAVELLTSLAKLQ